MLLAIDTATRTISLALHDGERIHAELTWRTANHHTVELSPSIMTMLAQAGLTVGDLTALAVAQGPGSFMGLRIGLGVAKGLALSRRLPLVAVPTLDIVAAAQPRTRGRLVAVLQAGRGRICWQAYTWRRGKGRTPPAMWRPRGKLALGGWDDLIAEVEKETVVSGEIDPEGRRRLSETDRPVRAASGALALRRAGHLAEIAWARLRADATDDPFTVTPIYLH
ncbi:MAG: tRNA (adenosine(37)-N6)-threonylcarbamoyltransferase complex dimerization subunit type 1 TsaB [Anaerolineae bacterium]|nr:tRNA (adenosine(37)-N6)-threonylcarbamoyltransferase complex dimerization subunit type 1 TsaB [Anaerolineae bacterium]